MSKKDQPEDSYFSRAATQGRRPTRCIASNQLYRSYPKVYYSFMRAILTTESFDAWFTGLTDRHGKLRIQARIDRAQTGNLGDCEPVGEGVSEMRIHTGPGYRVYLTQRGEEIIVLLAGGDKRSQPKDIKRALLLARNL